MSSSLTVHVGPYAEFLVPEGQAVIDERLEEALEAGPLNHNLESQETVVVDGVKCERACFAPYFGSYSELTFKPPRQMYWSGDAWAKTGHTLDLSNVAIEEEVAWFKRVYADALKALEEGYGQPVRIRWGVVPSIG